MVLVDFIDMKKKLKIFDLLIKEKFNRKWCAWAYGMNMFDLTGSDKGGVHRTKSAAAKIGNINFKI